MTLLTGESIASRYRLGGRLDGVEYSFDLTLGEHRVGSSPESDVRLPFESVSRQHAMLRVMADGLAVEDRGSKNGTFVDGRRVDRAAVSAGARVGFGPVELEVEDVDPEDVDLAFVVDAAGDEASRSASAFRSSRETASYVAQAERPIAEAWLWLVEGFAQRLYATPRGDPAGALAYLLENLGATGACVAEWVEGGDPVVLAAQGLAAAGPSGEIPSQPEIEELPAPARRPRDPPDATSFHSNAACTVALLGGAENPPLGLWIWGDFAGRGGSEILLRTLLRLLDRLRPWAIHQAGETAAAGVARARHPELVFPDDYLPGISPAMTAVYRQMRALLKGDMPILITGETGVGKERLAAILHQSSDRREGPLVAINCAAIPAELLEAELFGIGKGVATGVTRRLGRFQQAEAGTLLLDEIGEMLPALQAKLLRALQEKQIQPVGGRPQKVDVRIVAATNADLKQKMDRGDFRRDLYYRLAGYTLEVPALRQCPEDIPPLIEHFLRSFAREAGSRLRGITVKALRRLAAYSWPGNVRELHHEIRRLVYLCQDGGVIDAGRLSPHLVSANLGEIETSPTGAEDLLLTPRLRRLEDLLIREALRRSGGRQVHAARMLGISRNGLADKIKRLGIDPRAFRP